MKSLDQDRAAAAYQAIAKVDTKAGDMAVKLPVMLQINGLLATWASLLAKEAKKESTPLDALLGHLRSLPELQVPAHKSAHEIFLFWVGGEPNNRAGVSGTRLRALTAEALAFAVWLKRAAESREKSSDSGGSGGGDG